MKEHAGSGMHIHISMQNSRPERAGCARRKDLLLLKKMLAGMIDLMPSSMALLAPNVKTYCCFQRQSKPTVYSVQAITPAPSPCVFHAAIARTTAPYRVAGADANPYLVMAAFCGILHGLDNEMPLQEEVEGSWAARTGCRPFPIRQSDALGEFIERHHLRRH
ncbi:hypothetical protein ACLK15_07520 [Escherichia coli]